jgi:hypothetical protein
MAKHKPKLTGKGGYGDPPRHSQFKKGKSGNPGGRPKGSRSFASALRAEGDELVTLTINGKKVRRTKRQLAAQVTWAEAIKANFKYQKLIAEADVCPAQDEVAEEEVVRVVMSFGEEPDWVAERREAFAREYPNYHPDRPSSEWGPDDPDSVH